MSLIPEFGTEGAYNVAQIAGAAPLASPTFTGTVTTAALAIGDGSNVALGTVTGTKFGTATNQRIGFFNAAPVVQQTGDLLTALSNLGLLVSATVALPSAATATTQAVGDNSTSVATTAYTTKKSVVYGPGLITICGGF